MTHSDWSPLPASLAPMLATPGSPPGGQLAQWAVEMKWDGVRALAFIEDGRVRLAARSGRDITGTYPELAGLGALTGAGRPRQLLLDGEIVAFTGGRPDFEALQPRMHVSSPEAAMRLSRTIPVAYLGFDVLQRDGRPLTARPYRERRDILTSITPNEPGRLFPPHFPGPDLDAVRAAAVAHGLEGVVAKRLESPYEPGSRSGAWLKIKTVLRQEVVVAGWKPGEGNRTGLIGSLLVGVYSTGRMSDTFGLSSDMPSGGTGAGGDGGQVPPMREIRPPGGLLYCGHVGTGFTDQTLRMLTRMLEPMRRPGSPFDGEVPAEYARPAVWVEPRLVVEVTFTRWTKAGRMIAPAYQGLRDDKDPADVVRET